MTQPHALEAGAAAPQRRAIVRGGYDVRRTRSDAIKALARHFESKSSEPNDVIHAIRWVANRARQS